MSKPCQHCRKDRAEHVRASKRGPACCADGVTEYKPARDCWGTQVVVAPARGLSFLPPDPRRVPRVRWRATATLLAAAGALSAR